MGLMRNLLLCVTVITGLLLPAGVVNAQNTAQVTATCKDGTAFPVRSGRAPVEVMVACSPGESRPIPRTRSLNHPLRPAREPLRLLVAQVRFGSTRRAKCTTAPVLAGTARPNRAATCP